MGPGTGERREGSLKGSVENAPELRFFCWELLYLLGLPHPRSEMENCCDSKSPFSLSQGQSSSSNECGSGEGLSHRLSSVTVISREERRDKCPRAYHGATS